MSAEDWYRNEVWDAEIAEEFEARLKRSRGAYYKAQYLRIQAGILLGSDDEVAQNAGIMLMRRMIDSYPDEKSSTIFGHEQLGDYYFARSDYENAIRYYDFVTGCYKENPNSRNGTSWIADLKLAGVILRTNRQERFDEAYDICRNYRVRDISLNSDKYYYYELSALICHALGKSGEASEYASKALKMFKVTEPQFAYHKKVGLVDTSAERLAALRQIASD